MKNLISAVGIALFLILATAGANLALAQSGDKAALLPGGRAGPMDMEVVPAMGRRWGEAAVSEDATLLVEEGGKVRKFAGRVTWRFEPGKAGDGGSLRAEVEIPQTGLRLLLTLTRNVDEVLPASHVVELNFITPEGSSHSAVERMGNVVMKMTEDDTDGVALWSSVVAIKDGLFLVGLTQSFRERNVSLLRERSGMEIPFTFANQQRALLWFEKGPSGTRALNQALVSWGDAASEAAPGEPFNATAQFNTPVAQGAGASAFPPPGGSSSAMGAFPSWGDAGLEAPQKEAHQNQALAGRGDATSGVAHDTPSNGADRESAVKAAAVPAIGTPPTIADLLVPSQAVLEEVDPGKGGLRRSRATVSWRFDPGFDGDTGTEESVRAEVEFREAGLKLQLALKRNTDSRLPASHVVKIAFTSPGGSPDGGVESIGNIVMKARENASGGVALGGSVARLTEGVFQISLTQSMRSALEVESWLEIPVVFAGQRPAVIRIEKGAAGAQLFHAILAPWVDSGLASDRACTALKQPGPTKCR